MYIYSNTITLADIINMSVSLSEVFWLQSDTNLLHLITVYLICILMNFSLSKFLGQKT